MASANSVVAGGFGDTSSDDDVSKFLAGINSPKGAYSGASPPPKEKPAGQQNNVIDINKILQSMPKMPEPPKLHDIPSPTDQQFHSPFKDFSGPAMFLVALGSLMTRHPMKVAMDSFSAMVNASVQGQKEVMTNARENMKVATDTAIKQNEVEIERYKLIMEKYKEDANQQVAAMMAQASGFNHPMMAAMVKTGNPANVWSYIQDLETQGEKLREFQLKHEEFEEKQRHNKALEGQGADVDKTAQAIAEYRMPPPSPANRSPQVQAIRERVLELNPEYDASKYAAKAAGATSGARAAGTRSANLELIQRNLEAAIPQAEAASAQVPRGKWVPINQLVQRGEVATSDPNYAKFAMTNLQVAELWARAMNPSGVMREGDRDKALQYLNVATSPETYKQQLQVLRDFVQRERQSTEEFRQGKEPSVGGNQGWKVEEVQ